MHFVIALGFFFALGIPCEGFSEGRRSFWRFGFFCHFECNLDFENVLGISTTFAILSHRCRSSGVCVGIVCWLSFATHQAMESKHLLRT